MEILTRGGRGHGDIGVARTGGGAGLGWAGAPGEELVPCEVETQQHSLALHTTDCVMSTWG